MNYLISLIGLMFLNTAMASQDLQITQESDFRYMYHEGTQVQLLYEAENIVKNTLASIGCTQVNAKGVITEKMHDPNFFAQLFGDDSKSARFQFTINATCPSHVTRLEAFVSFAFHLADTDTVFYYAFLNSKTNEINSGVIIDSWHSLPKEYKDFTGDVHCTEDWATAQEYQLLKSVFCQ